jgi:hypothetical protein
MGPYTYIAGEETRSSEQKGSDLTKISQVGNGKARIYIFVCPLTIVLI